MEQDLYITTSHIGEENKSLSLSVTYPAQTHPTATTMALPAPYYSLTALLVAFTLIHHPVTALKPPATCTDELVKFSPCLAYVSLPPNNLSDVVPSKCCEAFTSEFDSGEAICLCYLLQEPLIFGFPMDDARVLSLSSVCPLKNDSSARTGSLQLLCSGSQALPPLSNTTTSGISGTGNASSPENSSTPSSLPPIPLDSPIQLPSSATKDELCRGLFGLTLVFVYTISIFRISLPSNFVLFVGIQQDHTQHISIHCT